MSCLCHPSCSHWISRARARLGDTLGTVFGGAEVFLRALYLALYIHGSLTVQKNLPGVLHAFRG